MYPGFAQHLQGNYLCCKLQEGKEHTYKAYALTHISRLHTMQHVCSLTCTIGIQTDICAYKEMHIKI